MGQKSPADQGSLATLLDQGKESAADLALRTRRQAQRVRLALEVRRLEARVKSEIDALGHDVFPLLREGALHGDLPPAVGQRLRAIAKLQDELERKSSQSSAAGRDEAKRKSTVNTDANATEAASAVQTAEDDAAVEAGQPADQGGQG